MNIYAGNLSYQMTDSELETIFADFGSVASAKIIQDRETRRSKGFGFVEMDDSSGSQAIATLNGKEVNGRKIVVNEARPKPQGGRR